MEPESGTDTPDGLWRLGIFVEDVENSFEKLRADPMRLLSWFSPPRPQPCCKDRVLAICKLCLLNTFDHVHEYSGKKGVPLRAANAQQVCFPHVTLAAYSDMGDGKETVLMNISNFVEPHTGLTQPTSPTILLASPSFLASQGYFNRELVWVQVYTPLPLNQVILSAQSSGGRVRLTPPAVKQAMQQFSQIMRRETVLIRQDCIYSFPVSFSLDGSGEQVHEMAEFAVLECSPVQQGRLVEDTMLAVLPLADVDTTRDDKLMFAGDEASFPPQFFVRRKSRSLTRSGSTEFYHDSFEKSYDSKHSYITSTSASDLCNEADPSIEVATHPSIKLHRHYVILPKGFALQHKMTEYQPVLLAAEKTMQSGTAQLADLVLSVRPRSHRGGEAEGSHWALVLWYDGIMELERYVPPPYPGYLYEPGAIQTAYVHPYLLYSLFHETLSPTRRYYISFKKSKGAQEGDFTRVKSVSVAPVGVPAPHPQLKQEDIKTTLQQYFQKKTHLVAIGDIFSVNFETVGTVHYRITALDPVDSCKIDSGLREISWKIDPVNYPLPHGTPLSPYMPPPPYFSHLLPPGLQGACLSLFSMILPQLQPDHALRPSRSPAVLITGPGGVGKSTVARAVCRRIRAHLLELNCYNYCNDSVGLAEKAFTADAARAFQCSPCLVLLRNVHMLGKDNNKTEPRLATAFHYFMYYVSKYNKKSHVDYPIVVVATSSNPGDIPVSVAMEFLHTIRLTTPTEAERLAMLQALSRDYLLAPAIPWNHFARQTAGYLLGDLVSLLSRASHLATAAAIQHYEANCSAAPSFESLAVSGVATSLCHLEQALSSLHSTHSDAIGAPKIPDVHWEDVGGLAEAKQEVLDAIQLPVMHPDLFSGDLRRSGILLYGPPGTGKTLLAKAVATECGIHFLSVKGPELINMYVGQTEENVRNVFTKARGAAPCIIFFDELDSIAPNRGKTGDSGGVMDRVVSQLLAELDGLQKSNDVFVIGATNRPDLLDPALLRPGRFDRLVYLGACEDEQSREKILRAITRKFNLAGDMDLGSLAADCPAHTTGADLYALCSEALLMALRRTIQTLEEERAQGSAATAGGEGGEGVSAEAMEDGAEALIVTKDDFLSAMAHLTPSVAKSELERYQELRKSAVANTSPPHETDHFTDM